MTMKVKIVRIDKSLPLPEYQTPGSVAFDLYSRTDETVAPNKFTLLPSNLIIEVPSGHVLILSARSSLAKKGLQLANGVGVIDQDYHGPKDEIGILVFNFTENDVTVIKGERIAQGLIVPISKPEWEEVDTIKNVSRGGFGSTG